jgi:DNA-binding NarL/FixJ family response regulator
MDRAIKTLVVDDEPIARQILREELTLLSTIDFIGEAHDKEALYNFLSTFSGTHYVSPRAITATIGFHF